MEGADDPVAGLDPRYPVANGSDLARAVGKRHDAELCRTATAAFEDHQIAVVKRAGAHPHQDLLRPGTGILARSQDDSVDAAEAVDALSFHPSLFLLLNRKRGLRRSSDHRRARLRSSRNVALNI